MNQECYQRLKMRKLVERRTKRFGLKINQGTKVKRLILVS